MPKISTGLVPAAIYATKTRRAVYRLLQSYIKKDKEWGKVINDEIGKLNRALFHLFTVDLKINKTDVIRLRIEFDVDEESRKIIWKWDTLELEVYRKLPSEEVKKYLDHFISKVQELMVKPINYSIEKVATTPDGDEVYVVRLDHEEVGAALILVVDENTFVMKKAGILHPVSVIYEKTKVLLDGRSIEQALQDEFSGAVRKGVQVEFSEVLKTINMIREKASLKPIEKPEDLEEL
ncbi:MAG: DUF2258 domain-containing protein [Thermosphaera sp.]